MTSQYRKPLPNSDLEYFDTRQAVNDITPDAYDKLPYTSRILAEQLVRKVSDPNELTAALKQLINRERTLDFPWYPARVVCHDILGQTALVDLAGLRDAIAEQGGDPSKVNPVVQTQLIVDHSLAVECGGYDPDAFEKNRAIEDRRARWRRIRTGVSRSDDDETPATGPAGTADAGRHRMARPTPARASGAASRMRATRAGAAVELCARAPVTPMTEVA